MLEIHELLGRRETTPLLDVRSPGEYTHGHIPGAISFPLFTDEERAEVGTMYKQAGKEEAMELGLRFVGPKLETFVKDAKALAPERKVMVHCWRGGQRSGSIAWLLRQAGFEVEILPGGYKAYRKLVLDSFESSPLQMVILGGQTGSGKTKILYELDKQGEQIIDLEGLANHKGSAFGFIGELPQPTVEQFENDLFERILALDLSKRIWIENESHSIGRIFIPEPFWVKMRVAPLINLKIPDEARIENLLEDYVLTDKADLETAFNKISKKLGGQNLKEALEALERNDFASAARIALWYYDKTYQHGIDITRSIDLKTISFDHGKAAEIAQKLMLI